MERPLSFAGYFVMIGLAWLLSENKRRFPWRVVIVGSLLQFVLALLILKTQPGAIIFSAIGDAFTWVFTDIRGYGQRKDEQGDQSLEESAGDIIALADELGAERFSVVGHSMGGAVIQKVLAMAPDRVEALVGVCPVSSTPTPFDEAGRELFWGAPEDREKRDAIIDFTTGNRNTPEFVNAVTDWSVEHSTKEAFTNVLEAWTKPDFAEDVKGKELPVLVLAGEHDPALGKETCEQTWMQLFPKVRLEVVANAGHYPMFEAPVNLATRINNFLKETGN